MSTVSLTKLDVASDLPTFRVVGCQSIGLDREALLRQLTDLSLSPVLWHAMACRLSECHTQPDRVPGGQIPALKVVFLSRFWELSVQTRRFGRAFVTLEIPHLLHAYVAPVGAGG